MSDKPTVLPEWATGGSAVVTTPSVAKQELGWETQEKPPAQHLNWIKLHTYNWLDWLNAGVFQRSDVADHSPVISTADREGRHRHYVGPEGYFMGPAVNETHRWGPVNTTTDLASAATVSVLGSRLIRDANTSCRIQSGTGATPTSGDPILRLGADTSASNQRAFVPHEYGSGTPNIDQPIGDTENNVAVMEYRCSVSSTTLTGVKYISGFHDFAQHAALTVLASTNLYAIIYADSGSTEWTCAVANGSGVTSVASGVTITADTYFTMRIELHGVNSPVGVGAGTAVARFFIDGVMVQEISTANVPSGTYPLGYFHMITGVSLAADRFYSVGTTKVAWTQALAANVPA